MLLWFWFFVKGWLKMCLPFACSSRQVSSAGGGDTGGLSPSLRRLWSKSLAALGPGECGQQRSHHRPLSAPHRPSEIKPPQGALRSGATNIAPDKESFISLMERQADPVETGQNTVLIQLGTFYSFIARAKFVIKFKGKKHGQKSAF